MKRFSIFFITIILSFSCDLTGVKQPDEKEDDLVQLMGDNHENHFEKDTVQLDLTNDVVLDSVSYDNGITISWREKGKGPKVKSGDLVRIRYKNALPDGTVYDGNHLIKKSSIPFFVGWKQQTKGWDFAFEHLNVGDDVDVFMPSDLARGEKGIPGLVPPNSPNILSVQILEIMEPTAIVDGTRLWVLEQKKESTKRKIEVSDNVKMHYWVSSETNPRYDNSYQRGEPFELVMGDENIVPGLFKSLQYAREGDKLMIHIPAKEAYGDKGLVDFVKPGQDILYDVLIMEASQ